MPTEAPLISWLDHLWQLYPAQGVLLVGAGSGTSPWIDALQRWNAPSVMLVEADETQFMHLQRSQAARDGWHLRKQVVAEQAGSVTYHQASNPAESGLLEPESLRSLWPNLKTRQKGTRQAITLAELLPMTAPAANWLLLDCLPAAALLAGAGQALDGVDVILTRALLGDTTHAGLTALADADAIAQRLKANGFSTVATQTGRHPNVVHTLHVRDRAAQISRLMAELTQAREGTQQAQNKATQTEQQLKHIQAEAATWREAAEKAQAQASHTQAQAADAQAAAAKTLQERDAQLKTLQAELAQAKEAAQQATAQSEHSQQQLDKLQAEAAQWREAAEKAQAQASLTQAQAADAQAAAAKTLQERDAQLKTLQAELARAQEAAQQAAAQAEHSRHQLEKHQAEAHEWREAADKARDEVAQTQAQAREAQAEATQTLTKRDAELNAIQAELKLLQRALLEADERAACAERKLLNLDAQMRVIRETDTSTAQHALELAKEIGEHNQNTTETFKSIREQIGQTGESTCSHIQNPATESTLESTIIEQATPEQNETNENQPENNTPTAQQYTIERLEKIKTDSREINKLCKTLAQSITQKIESYTNSKQQQEELKHANESLSKELATIKQNKQQTEARTKELEQKNALLANEFQKIHAEITLLKELLLIVTSAEGRK